MDTFLTPSSSFEANKSDCSTGLEDGNKMRNNMNLMNKEDELTLAKAEMEQMREENTKLKKMLVRIEREYQSLHTRFNDTARPQRPIEEDIIEETELVSLTLGRNLTEPKSDKKNSETMNINTLKLLNNGTGLKIGTGKSLSLSKVLRTTRSSGDDEETTLQQPSAKRARVSVRARCDSVTMNDGCQWRKYGQKTAKGNPCPRAYYRCTVAPGCPVRKQVQRCMDDMSILTTTYEGTHNHPLSISATSMASTTSAAASMLLSGSSTSATATSPSIFQGLNLSAAGNNSYSRPTPFYLPNTSPNAFSTITLDLTGSGFSSPQTKTLPSTIYGSGYLNYGTMPYSSTPINSQFYSVSNSENGNQATSQQILTETLTKAITSDPSLRSVINAAISSMVSKNGENDSNIPQASLQFSL